MKGELDMIRKIEQVDIPDCVKLIKNAFMTVADEFDITEENAPRFTAFAMSEERLLWQYNNEHRPMFVYCANDKIVGYYSLALSDNAECELNNLCVSPDYRHKGIGSALLKHAFEQAKANNCTAMNIGIVKENKVLHNWYKTFGFVHTHTQKFDFFPFECEYMKKEL